MSLLSLIRLRLGKYTENVERGFLWLLYCESERFLVSSLAAVRFLGRGPLGSYQPPGPVLARVALLAGHPSTARPPRVPVLG